jgi:Cytochrome P450
LRNELKNTGSIDWQSLSQLEILDGVIKEALRVHSAAPASLWREIPAGGLVLDGHFIPEKVHHTTFLLILDCRFHAMLFYPSQSYNLPKSRIIRSIAMDSKRESHRGNE